MTLEYVGEFRQFGLGSDKVTDAGLVFLCGHCQNIFTGPRKMINDHRLEGANYCRRCERNICKKPECNARCHPFEEKLEAIQRNLERQRLRALL